jgi:hypothetical protein
MEKIDEVACRTLAVMQKSIRSPLPEKELCVSHLNWLVAKQVQHVKKLTWKPYRQI